MLGQCKRSAGWTLPRLLEYEKCRDFATILSAFESAIGSDDGKEAHKAMWGHIKFLDDAIGEELGIRSRPDKPVAIELLTQAGSKILHHKYPFLRLFPPIGTVFSRITDRVLLRVNNPRRNVLQMVGESIIAGAGKGK